MLWNVTQDEECLLHTMDIMVGFCKDWNKSLEMRETKDSGRANVQYGYIPTTCTWTLSHEAAQASRRV